MMSGFGVALSEGYDVEGDNGRQVLLITGGAGNVAGLLRPRLARKDRTLRLLDIAPVDDLGPCEEVVTASITDADAVARACAGAFAVLHLGALSNEAPWADILAVNVDGTRTVLEAARDAGVHRVILASSNHAAGFHTRDEAPVAAEAPPRPDTYYGFSKAAIEALGSLYASRYELNVACLRIGTCFAEPPDVRALATWLSPDDAARLIEACLSAPAFGFRVVWGISANTRRWWSLEEGRALGYEPHDDAEAFAEKLVAEHGELNPEDPDYHLLGGTFCLQPLGEWRH
jgi:uronate dehydrogenase